MNSEALVQLFQTALATYAQQYGLPISAEQLRGVVGSLVSTWVGQTGAPLSSPQAEQLIQLILGGFNQNLPDIQSSNNESLTLVQAAHQERENLAYGVSQTLAAYIQEFAPDLPSGSIREIILTAIPLLADGHITPSEVYALISQILQSFNLNDVLNHSVDPSFLEIAKKVDVAFNQKSIEEAVTETVIAYVRKFEPNLEIVGDSLITNAIVAILSNKVEFAWDGELNLEDQSLLIKQVSFKVNIAQADPPASKTAEEIADQLHTEVERFKAERADALGTSHTAGGITGDDDLTVSSGWRFTGEPTMAEEPTSMAEEPSIMDDT